MVDLHLSRWTPADVRRRCSVRRQGILHQRTSERRASSSGHRSSATCLPDRLLWGRDPRQLSLPWRLPPHVWPISTWLNVEEMHALGRQLVGSARAGVRALEGAPSVSNDRSYIRDPVGSGKPQQVPHRAGYTGFRAPTRREKPPQLSRPGEPEVHRERTLDDSIQRASDRAMAHRDRTPSWWSRGRRASTPACTKRAAHRSGSPRPSGSRARRSIELRRTEVLHHRIDYELVAWILLVLRGMDATSTTVAIRPVRRSVPADELGDMSAVTDQRAPRGRRGLVSPGAAAPAELGSPPSTAG